MASPRARFRFPVLGTVAAAVTATATAALLLGPVGPVGLVGLVPGAAAAAAAPPTVSPATVLPGASVTVTGTVPAGCPATSVGVTLWSDFNLDPGSTMTGPQIGEGTGTVTGAAFTAVVPVTGTAPRGSARADVRAVPGNPGDPEVCNVPGGPFTVAPAHRNLQITAPSAVSPGNAFTVRARHCVGTAFDLMFLDAAGRQSWATYAGGWASILDVDTQGWANPPPDPQEYEVRFAPPAGARTGAGRVRIGCSQSVTPAGGDSVPVTVVPASTRLAVTRSPATTSYPGAVTLTATLTRVSTGARLNGRQIRVSVRPYPGMAWTYAGYAWTDATGTARFRHVPAAAAAYSLRFPGDAGAGPALANDLVVQVRGRVGAAASRNGAPAGTPQVISGNVIPNVPGGPVSLSRLTNQGWRHVGGARVRASGRYDIPVTLPAPGTHTLRVTGPGRTATGTCCGDAQTGTSTLHPGTVTIEVVAR